VAAAKVTDVENRLAPTHESEINLLIVKSTRMLIWAGFLLYVSSFFLPAVGGTNPYEPGRNHLFEWVADWFFWPFIYIH
jgi:hypothetical protein